jgi:deoxyribonuclease V
MNSMDGWPTTFEAAQALQEQLRSQVITSDALGEVRTVAGVDAGYEPDPDASADSGAVLARAAIVVLDYPSLRPLDYTIARRPATFPYVPGFLSFRETPAVLAAIEQLRVRPDLLICDGQGIAHPRRFGIACHVGLLTGIPAIGCAKSLLVGRHAPVPDQRGAAVPLTHRGEQVGVALRTRVGTKPLFISVGHRISLTTAIEYVMSCTTKYRLPETTRAADGLASHGRVPSIAGDQQQPLL